MSARLASLPLDALHAWARRLPVMLALAACVAHGEEQAASAGAAGNPAMRLAADIAATYGGTQATSKSELLAAYENTYGSINGIPARWPALVRRLLVCRETVDQACIRTSMAAIGKLGGLEAFPLDHLLEVSRFKLPVATIQARLRDAAQAAFKDTASRLPPVAAPHVANAIKSTSASIASAPPGISVNARNGASAAAQASAKPSAKPSAVKSANPRSFMQRASARLQRLGAGDQSAYFLDALFIAVALCLVMAYFLFAATRARKMPADSSVAQEIRKMEESLAAEKLRMEQALSLERKNSEATRDAQMAQAGKLINETKLAAEQAIEAEKSRALEMLKDERMRVAEVIEAANTCAEQSIEACAQMATAELEKAQGKIDELRQALQAEKERGAAQELKTGEALQASATFKEMEQRLRDATQMTAGELAQALERIDALQLALDAEKQQRAAAGSRLDEALKAIDALKAMEAPPASASPQEAEDRLRQPSPMAAGVLAQALERIGALQQAFNAEQQQRAAAGKQLQEALQTVNALKATETRLRDAIRIQQSADLSETRQLKEKLKSAQLAAIALHKSLVAARALNTDLERRADEAMRAAEVRIAEVRQLHATRLTQEAGKMGTGVETAGSAASNDA